MNDAKAAGLAGLIINADDLGESAAHNDAIFGLMDEGLVTSATIVARGDAAEEAMRRAGNYARCSFGVHLYATDYRSVTNHPGLNGLLEANGNFNRQLWRRRWLGPGMLRGLYAEFCGQIDLVQSRGVRVSHLDSHHHIHTLPWVFPVVKVVQRRYGIRKMRMTISIFPQGESAGLGRRAKKAVFCWGLHWLYRTITTTDCTDFMNYYAWLRAGRKFGPGTIELMVHPGAGGAQYVQEVADLRAWGTTTERGRLMNYNQLERS